MIPVARRPSEAPAARVQTQAQEAPFRRDEQRRAVLTPAQGIFTALPLGIPGPGCRWCAEPFREQSNRRHLPMISKKMHRESRGRRIDPGRNDVAFCGDFEMVGAFILSRFVEGRCHHLYIIRNRVFFGNSDGDGSFIPA